MEQFYIGQIFENEYPIEAADFCNNRGDCYIEEIETIDDVRRFQIVEVPEETEEERKQRFMVNFFEIPPIEGVFQGGWYRKKPKGYSSAIESMITAFSAVAVMKGLPAGYLTFYTAPDFADKAQCTEEWLVANTFKNEAMTQAEFDQFHAAFITVWNAQEHM